MTSSVRALGGRAELDEEVAGVRLGEFEPQRAPVRRE